MYNINYHTILASLIIVTYLVAIITLGVQFKPCLWCIYIGLAHYILQYCNNTVGYSYILYFTIITIYNTDTECTTAIASTLIHAVVLCESAQRYRALMVILQSHRTQNMILRCYPTVSAIYFGDTPNLVSCAFSTIPIIIIILKKLP